MNPFRDVLRWLDIRPHETRPLLLSFGGAFLVIGFLILARSLREALYLSSFDIKTLPYITASVAILGLPTVAVFARMLTRYSARAVLRTVLIVQGSGLAFLWPLLPVSDIAVVVFYLWTALGTLVITSGFWIVTSEVFPLRSAKRLFGVISAGGTSGAMIIGTSLSWLTDLFDLLWLVPGLMGLIGLFFITQRALPPLKEEVGVEPKEGEQTSLREGFTRIWENPHLKTIALIVMTATIATTLLDYQFKELVRAEVVTKEGLTSFFGAFYGWTGAASLMVQLFLGARLLKVFGVGGALSVLPIIVLLGSFAFLWFSGLPLITLIRGADNSLRKSLHRSVLEVLYVPIPSRLRRKTKTFIDSVLDSISEGIGAGVIFVWVTWWNFSSIFLSLFIMGLTGGFLVLARGMKQQYFQTLLTRLQEGDTKDFELAVSERVVGRDLLTASMAQIDLSRDLGQLGIALPSEKPPLPVAEVPQSKESTLDMIRSSDTQKVLRALREGNDWGSEHVPALINLLARDTCRDQATELLINQSAISVTPLVHTLRDEHADFVIRRRIPNILAVLSSEEAGDALVAALRAKRFEIRYRAAIALQARRRNQLATPKSNGIEQIWEAVRFEVCREKAVWEMQRLLDKVDAAEKDDLIERHIDVRGMLSLEHTFRMLTLVLDPIPVRIAFYGILLVDERLKSFALEYLEHVLPEDIRKNLWPHIGDVSEAQRKAAMRPLNAVVSDLMTTGATLFADEASKKALRRALGTQ